MSPDYPNTLPKTRLLTGTARGTMRIQRQTVGAAVAMALLLIAGGTSVARGQETHRVTGSAITVYNLAGHARVVRGSGSDVVVRVTRGGKDRARLDIRTGESDGRTALIVVYPDDRVVYPEMGTGSRSSLRVRDDGTFGGEEGSRGDMVDIRGSGRGLEAWADLVIEVPAGKDFALQLAAGQADVQGADGTFALHTGSGSIEASDVSGSIWLETGSGSASVQNVKGDLRVDTGSGSIAVRGVSGGSVDLETGSGSVRGGGIQATTLRVDTGSGSIELDDVTTPDAGLDTGSGSVDLVLMSDVDRLDVETGSGSVTVSAPADLGANVDIQTGSGGIDLDFAVQVQSVRRDHLVGKLGDGRGRIRIETGSGRIRILKN